MSYTIIKLARIAGVSVRTLHYYDKIGLLRPEHLNENGYRIYKEKEVLKLQQILFFKELEFPLKDIRKMMNSPDFDTKEALREQRKLLVIKKKRIDGLLLTIDTMLKHSKGGEKTMSDDDLFKSFGDDQLTQYMDEAKRRWGNTDAYKQSMLKVKKWTKDDYKRIKEDGKKFTQELANAMDKDIKSPEVQALIEKHHQGIEYFYECPLEMYRNLGKMYVEDPRFIAYYDKFKPGLAQWLCKSIEYYCDHHQSN